MSKSQRIKPPISKARIRERLSKAQEDLSLVRVKRWIRGADQVEGFVVATSKTWVLLATLNDRIDLDGWAALRVADVQAVTRYAADDCFEIKALQARQQWPPTPPADCAIDTLDNIVRTAQQDGRLVTLHREHERPQVCWIGTSRGTRDGFVSLLEVTTEGWWARKARWFDTDDITRIDFGGRYEDALRVVAGPAPRTSAPR